MSRNHHARLETIATISICAILLTLLPQLVLA